MVKLSDHAKEVVALRSLQIEWILAALDSPDAVRPDARRPGVTLSFKAVAASCGRVLRVAHRPDGPDVLVITAYFDRGAKL